MSNVAHLPKQVPDKQPIPVKAAATVKLEEVLRSKEVGEVATYAELGEAANLNIQGKGRSNLYSALRTLVKEGRVFGVVMNVGYERLDDSKNLKARRSEERRIDRATKRNSKKSAFIETKNLTPEEIGELNEFNLRQALKMTAAKNGIVKQLMISNKSSAEINGEKLQLFFSEKK